MNLPLIFFRTDAFYQTRHVLPRWEADNITWVRLIPFVDSPKLLILVGSEAGSLLKDLEVSAKVMPLSGHCFITTRRDIRWCFSSMISTHLSRSI